VQLSPAQGIYGPFIATGGFRGRTPPADCRPGLTRRAIVLANVGRWNSFLLQGDSAVTTDPSRTFRWSWRFRSI
jgi:hypothetical protein